jgi:hypothetical protein
VLLTDVEAGVGLGRLVVERVEEIAAVRGDVLVVREENLALGRVCLRRTEVRRHDRRKRAMTRTIWFSMFV